jgi:hypothetical protein
MNLVIDPEPSEPERAAIERALAESTGDRERSAWWRRGIEEAVGLDDGGPDEIRPLHPQAR